MIKSNPTRRYVDIALFGAVGGALEAVLGTITHWFRFIPFAGLIPTAALIAVLAALYTFNRTTRDVVFCGVVIAFLKLLSPGGIIIIAVISVIIETVFFCIIVRLFPGPDKLKLALAGTIVSFWPIIHKTINLIVFVGIAVPEAINDIRVKAAQFFQMIDLSFTSILIILLLLHGTVGITAALTGQLIGNRLKAHRERQL